MHSALCGYELHPGLMLHRVLARAAADSYTDTTRGGALLMWWVVKGGGKRGWLVVLVGARLMFRRIMATNALSDTFVHVVFVRRKIFHA